MVSKMALSGSRTIKVKTDKVCFTCVQAVKKEGGVLFKGKNDDAFLTRGYCNWKDAAGNKHGGFPTYERSVTVLCQSRLQVVLFV